MAGAIGKGFIHFGGTDVAVKLHSAVREERIRFHLLHRNDQAHLRQQMICAVEKLPIPAEDQIKDFELEEGKYVIVDPGELEQIVPESNRMIEVHEFVKAEQVSPRCMEWVYALEPDRASPRGRFLRGAGQSADGHGCRRHLHLDHAETVLFRRSAGCG